MAKHYSKFTNNYTKIYYKNKLIADGSRDPLERIHAMPIDFHNKTLLDLGYNCGGTLFAVADKIKQGCSLILLSKLFLVDYKKKSPFLGVIKFNDFLKISKNLIPLGGIKEHNLNNLNNVLCEGFAILSEVKKKPANIINRLF